MPENNKITPKEHPNLYKLSIKGGYWVFTIKFLTQLLGLVKSIIIFNFLFNEHLELIFIANLLIVAMTFLSECGFTAALIQQKNNIDDYLDTAWVIGIIRGILLFTAIYFIAPLFASLKVETENIPLAVSVIRAMGICFLIHAFKNIGVIYFQKELEFHKTFWLTIVGNISEIVLTIVFVLIYRSVWAYVGVRLAVAVINLTMSYLLCPYRPKFHFVPEKARELWKFGKWLFQSNILGYLISEGDDWFVLLFFSNPLPFKLYRGAYQFANTPSTHIASVIAKVSFPAYSKIQDDLERLRKAYLKVLHFTAIVIVPISFLLFILGADFVRLFLVEESHKMIPILQICAINGLVGSLGYTRNSLLRAAGKPQFLTYLMALRLFLLIAMIYPFTKTWGIIGTASTTAIISIIVEPIALCIISRVLLIPTKTLLLAPAIPLASAGIMTGGIFLIKLLIPAQPSFLVFFILLFCGLIVYFILLWLLDKVLGHGHIKILCDQISIVKGAIGKLNSQPNESNSINQSSNN